MSLVTEPGPALSLSRAQCGVCDGEFVTEAQVERWPHLDRYRRGRDGHCSGCQRPPCLRCGGARIKGKKGGRGLCQTCYLFLLAHCPDELCDYPTAIRSADDVLDDWLHIGGPSIGFTLAAERLGMKRDSLYTVLRRAARRGDPRAVYEQMSPEVAARRSAALRQRSASNG